VAVSSRPKALAAWGVRQNLFQEDRAGETDDPALIEAALRKPGEAWTRPSGAQALAPVKASALSKRKPGRAAARQRRVAKLERELARLRDTFARRHDEIEGQLSRLEARRDEAKRRHSSNARPKWKLN
jgi:molecular chaperone GrpE (heat shock protein)